MSSLVATRTASSGEMGEELQCYTRQEVTTHKTSKDCWIIIHGEVYNITGWLKKHPGGKNILMHYAGEDATVSNYVSLSCNLLQRCA